MGEAMGLMERLQQMDRLESQLERGSFRPDDVDRSLAQQLLGDEARQAIDQLRKLTDVLEKAGYVERKGRRMEYGSGNKSRERGPNRFSIHWLLP